MKREHLDGRLFTPELTARLHRDGTALELRRRPVALRPAAMN